VSFLLVAAAAADGHYNATENAACREFEGSSCSDPCPKYDHVKLPIDNITLCEELCDARKDCTGFEYYGAWTRCEIWKIPIGATAANSNPFECHKYIGPQKMENKPVWVNFEVVFTGLNFSDILADESGTAAVQTAVVSSQEALLMLLGNQSDATGVQAANLTLSQVHLALGEATSSSLSVMATILPKEDVNPLAVYALLRGNNPDGIPNVKASIILKMEEIWGGLSNSSGVGCTIGDRDLAFSGPMLKDDQDDTDDKEDEEDKEDHKDDKNDTDSTGDKDDTDGTGDKDDTDGTGDKDDTDGTGDKDDAEGKDGGEDSNTTNTTEAAGASQAAMPAAMLIFLTLSLAAVVSAS
jgi:hypothetical protein